MSSSLSSRRGLVGLLLGVFVIVLGLSGYSLKLAGSVEQPQASHPAAIQDGAEIYETRCMSCHQMNGEGVPGVFPPLSDTEWVTGDKGRLIRVILNGLTGEIEVNGDSYSGAMPPWGSFLDDEDMSELLNYLRTSWDNDAEEITPEEVANVREAVADRTDPWTSEELEDAANQGIPGEEDAEEAGEKNDE